MRYNALLEVVIVNSYSEFPRVTVGFHEGIQAPFPIRLPEIVHLSDTAFDDGFTVFSEPFEFFCIMIKSSYRY